MLKTMIFPIALSALLITGCLDEPPLISADNAGDGSVDTTPATVSGKEFWLRAITINTEWLWNSDNDIDGSVLEPADMPSLAEYNAEIQYYASLIIDSKANLVALQEIEGCHILDDLKIELGPDDWNTVCATGRDTFTGQDVGILTQFPQVFGPTTFPEIWGEFGESRVRPSKVLGVVLDTPHGDLAIVTTHLLSKLNPDNDERRAAQAQAVNSGFYELIVRSGVQHGLVMGDLNDTPGSVPLSQLTGSGVLSNSVTVNGRPQTAQDCSYTYQGVCELIDHILITDSLKAGTFSVMQTDSLYTDHEAVLYWVPVPD